MDTTIIEAFRQYTKDPAKWFKRYRDQCRCYLTEEQKDASKKKAEEIKAKSKVSV